jgi:hypothetical protein
MAIEIVSFPIKNGDFPLLFVCLPKGKPQILTATLPGMEAARRVFAVSPWENDRYKPGGAGRFRDCEKTKENHVPSGKLTLVN